MTENSMGGRCQRAATALRNGGGGPVASVALPAGNVTTSGAFGTDPARRRFARLICFVGAALGWVNLAILGQTMLSKDPPQAGFDLQLLLDAGRRVAAGGSPYDPNAVASRLQARDLFYTYPPVVAQFLSPFSSLPTWLVMAGWCVGAVSGLAAVAFLLARSPIGRPVVAQSALPLDAALLAVAAAPFSFPFVAALLFGNVDAWFPFLFGAVALTLASRRSLPSRAASIAGGAALAVASIVKLHPATLVVWLAARSPAASGSRRATSAVVAAAIATGVAILAVSIVIGGLGPWRDYLDYMRIGANAGLTSPVNIGPASQLALLAGDPGLASPLSVAFAVLVVAGTLAAARFVRDPLESFGWAVVASLVVLPVTWYHYSVALIPIAVAAWTRSRGLPRGRSVTMALVAACVVADAAIMLPVALWLAVAALFMAVRWSRSLPLLEPAPQAEPVVPEGPAASPASVPG